MPQGEDHTRQALARLLEIFRSKTVSGYQTYFRKYPDTAHVHRSTTRSSIIRDHIVDELRAALIDDAGVTADDRNQTTYFRIDGEYCLLVKKADELGLVQLAKTQASFEFQCNEPAQAHFNTEIIPDVTNLYLSYVQNDDDPMFPAVFLICPREDGWSWRFEVEPPAVEIAGEISGGPISPAPEDEEDDLVRIPRSRKPGEPE